MASRGRGQAKAGGPGGAGAGGGDERRGRGARRTGGPGGQAPAQERGGRGHGHGHGHVHDDRRVGGHGPGRDHGHGKHGHGHHGHPGRDRHGNPADLAGYLARLEADDRRGWQKPDRVVASLGLRPGDVACDVGVGPGYFALRLARAVGDRGTVYAVDAEPRMLAILAERVREAGVANVLPILARGGKVVLPPRPCRVILVVNTFHHFRDGAAALRRLAGRLAPGGRIAVVDFHRRETPVGPPVDHRIAREAFLEAARAAGLRAVREHRFLPWQWFVEVAPPGARPVRRAGSAAILPRAWAPRSTRSRRTSSSARPTRSASTRASASGSTATTGGSASTRGRRR
jgi:SAM-dependent methyltransferase